MWGPWEPGTIWLELFRDAAVYLDQKAGGKVHSALLDFLLGACGWVCAHTCISVAFACIFVSFIISLEPQLFAQTKHSIHTLSPQLCPCSHFLPSLTASHGPRLPKANVPCHQFSEVLQIVINLKPQASVISLGNWASLRELSPCPVSYVLCLCPISYVCVLCPMSYVLCLCSVSYVCVHVLCLCPMKKLKPRAEFKSISFCTTEQE